MLVAIPLAENHLAQHFGHCEMFALVTVNDATKKIEKREDVKPPPHEPGLLPRWLAEKGANLVLAGGMGQRARELFAAAGITVVVGAPSETPEKLVAAYLDGTLATGANACDH